MALGNDEKVILDQWYFEFKARLNSLDEAVVELVDALAELQDRVKVVEDAIDRKQRQTGAEGTGTGRKG